MTVFLLILSCLLWGGAVWALYGRQMLAPALAYLGLLCVSFMRTGGYALLPLNMTILSVWLAMTLVVMVAVMLQTEEVRRQKRGMTFFIGGAAVGLALGLLGASPGSSVSLQYGWMIVGTALGTAFGFLLYTLTPEGRPVGIRSGRFFSYLLAKGFPTAITFMMLGVVLVLIIAMNNVNAL